VPPKAWEGAVIIRNANNPVREFDVLGVRTRVLLAREESESFEVLLEDYPPGVGFPPNSHEDMEQLYFILEGEGLATVGGDLEVVKAGDLVLIPRRAPHGIKNTGPSVLRYVCFDGFPEGPLPGEETWAGHEKEMDRKFGITPRP
jgi:mannose-6-phosphate isomerase-like protein (cupin superfamily)